MMTYFIFYSPTLKMFDIMYKDHHLKHEIL